MFAPARTTVLPPLTVTVPVLIFAPAFCVTAPDRLSPAAAPTVTVPAAPVVMLPSAAVVASTMRTAAPVLLLVTMAPARWMAPSLPSTVTSPAPAFTEVAAACVTPLPARVTPWPVTLALTVSALPVVVIDAAPVPPVTPARTVRPPASVIVKPVPVLKPSSMPALPVIVAEVPAEPSSVVVETSAVTPPLTAVSMVESAVIVPAVRVMSLSAVSLARPEAFTFPASVMLAPAPSAPRITLVPLTVLFTARLPPAPIVVAPAPPFTAPVTVMAPPLLTANPLLAEKLPKFTIALPALFNIADAALPVRVLARSAPVCVNVPPAIRVAVPATVMGWRVTAPVEFTVAVLTIPPTAAEPELTTLKSLAPATYVDVTAPAVPALIVKW